MWKYMVMVEVPSTAPLYGVNGINTKRKLRFVGWTRANNSSNACSKVSKRLDISYDKLKAMLFFGEIEGLVATRPEIESISKRV